MAQHEAMPESHVLTVTVENFQKEALQRSLRTPVLLDFWAEWCAPCKAMAPLLEQTATKYGGAFVLGKVDSDKEQELAYAFQVQSIPFLVLLHRGRPVDAITGAVGERELEAFLAQAGIRPAAAEAAKAEPAKPAADTPAARFEAAKKALRAGEFAVAEAALAKIPAEDDLQANVARLRDGIAWLQAGTAGAEPAAAALAAARAAFLAGNLAACLEHLLESVAADKAFGGGMARRATLFGLEYLPADDDQAETYRRRLATLLF